VIIPTCRKLELWCGSSVTRATFLEGAKGGGANVRRPPSLGIG
jgi:hypothetical protein